MSDQRTAACERDKQRTAHMGYIQAMDKLEWMSKRYTQHQCNNCQLWHVWRRK